MRARILQATLEAVHLPWKEWQCGGVPIVSLRVIERWKGKDKPVVRKASLELTGAKPQPFQFYKKIRDNL